MSVHLCVRVCAGRSSINLVRKGSSGLRLMVSASYSAARGRRFDPNSGRRVVSLSETYLHPLPSTVNTQEAVAPSRHD